MSSFSKVIITTAALSLSAASFVASADNGGWIQNETEFRYFQYDYPNTDNPNSYDAVEINKKLLQGSLNLTEQTSAWIDLRRIDYWEDRDNGEGWKRTGYHWDHEAHLIHKWGDVNFFGREWLFRPALGWEGDWNHQTGGDMNWSSNDYYVYFDFVTQFENGLTPWDNGQHTLNFRPLLSEYIVLGGVSKFHDSGNYRGHRQQVMNFFLASNWNENFFTFFSFRNYLDTMAKDGIKYHYGSENETILKLWEHEGFKVEWKNKLEFYLGMDSADEVLRDKFVEFYTRVQASYSKTFSNGINVKGLVGQDMWDYHYNDRPWVGGRYNRLETIAVLNVNVPLGY